MRVLTVVLVAVVLASPTAAQEMPPDYAAVLKALGKTGDFKDNVLKVNIPRTDLTVAVDGVLVPTPLGFGGWIAMTKGDGGMDVLMGDLVLTESEVNPVMSAVLNAGLDVTALHNHFLRDTPRVYYMHVHGMGTRRRSGAQDSPGRRLDRARSVRGHRRHRQRAAARPRSGDQLSKIIGHPGETERTRLQDHDRPARRLADRTRRHHQRAHGTQHLGGLCRFRRRSRRRG